MVAAVMTWWCIGMAAWCIGIAAWCIGIAAWCIGIAAWCIGIAAWCIGIAGLIEVLRNTQAAKQTLRMVKNPMPVLALYPAIRKNITSPPSSPATAAVPSSRRSIRPRGGWLAGLAAESAIGVSFTEWYRCAIQLM